MRVVLCGAGQIGAVHAASLSRAAVVSELIVADLDADRAAVLAERFGARATDLDQAFSAAPDAVVIGVPTPAHAGLVRTCIERRIPCLCEKPLAGELDESVALVREVEAASARVQVGFMRRFDPALGELRALIGGGEAGAGSHHPRGLTRS